MAILHETKSRVAPAPVRASEYNVPLSSAGVASTSRDRLARNSNSSMGYIIGVMALLVVGYLGYAYYWPNTSLGIPANQSSTTLSTPAAPAPMAPVAPSATAPAEPATPVAPPATAPADPVTPPTTTKTP